MRRPKGADDHDTGGTIAHVHRQMATTTVRVARNPASYPERMRRRQPGDLGRLIDLALMLAYGTPRVDDTTVADAFGVNVDDVERVSS